MSECKFYTATTEKISCFCELELAWAGGSSKRFEQTQIKTKEPAIPENHLLHGTSVAMYIVGQERRLVNPPSQVVAGVRTVTTNMDGRDALPRMSRPFALSRAYQFHSIYSRRCWTTNVNLPDSRFCKSARNIYDQMNRLV